jgi:hypothetical protein
MWEPRHLTTPWAFMACYRDCFTFFLSVVIGELRSLKNLPPAQLFPNNGIETHANEVGSHCSNEFCVTSFTMRMIYSLLDNLTAFFNCTLCYVASNIWMTVRDFKRSGDVATYALLNIWSCKRFYINSTKCNSNPAVRYLRKHTL